MSVWFRIDSDLYFIINLHGPIFLGFTPWPPTSEPLSYLSTLKQQHESTSPGGTPVRGTTRRPV